MGVESSAAKHAIQSLNIIQDLRFVVLILSDSLGLTTVAVLQPGLENFGVAIT
jgi:hypothetical protein